MKNKAVPGPILLVEKLDLITFLLIFACSLRYPGGLYITWSRSLGWAPLRKLLAGLARLRHAQFQDFKGTYYKVHRIVAESANDKLCDSSPDVIPVLQLLRSIKNHRLMEVAFRKVLAEIYTFSRIKTLVVMSELATTASHIVFIPADQRRFEGWVPVELLPRRDIVTTPWGTALWNAVRLQVTLWGHAGFALFACVFLLFQRRLTRRFAAVRKWPVGFDMHNTGIFWEKPYHSFFIFDDQDLAPQNVLHVVRNRLEDDRTRRHFEINRIPFVEASRIPIALPYYLKRILFDILQKTLSLISRSLVRPRRTPFIGAAVEVLFHHLLRAEILDTTHQTDVFLARDEYGVPHILRTLLYDLRGGKTVGYIHNDTILHESSVTYLSSHMLCFQGEFAQQLLCHNSKNSFQSRIIGAGVHGLDRTHALMKTGTLPQKYVDLKKKARLIGLMGAPELNDFPYSHEELVRFYKAVFGLLERRSDILLVVRLKSPDNMIPELQELMRKAGPRAVLADEIWTYELIPVLDLTICIAMTTIGLEVLMTGGRVLFYDETGFIDNPYETYKGKLVSHTPEELWRRADDVLSRHEYVEPAVLEEIKRRHGYQFDGNVVTRLRQAIRDMLPAKG